MVLVGKVRVCVVERLVPVPVHMAHRRLPGDVRVGVVRIVFVFVFVLVFERLVRVRVAVLLAQVEPDAQRHQRAGDQQLAGDWFAQQPHRQRRAEERGRREVGAGPGGAQVVFKEIADKTLNYLNVKPTLPQTKVSEKQKTKPTL